MSDLVAPQEIAILVWFRPLRSSRVNLQLHHPQFCTDPSCRQRCQRKRRWIPMLADSAAPRGSCAESAHHQTQRTRYERVTHLPVGGEPGNDVGADDAVDRAVCGRKQQELVGPPFALRRDHPNRLQSEIRPH